MSCCYQVWPLRLNEELFLFLPVSVEADLRSQQILQFGEHQPQTEPPPPVLGKPARSSCHSKYYSLLAPGARLYTEHQNIILHTGRLVM